MRSPTISDFFRVDNPKPNTRGVVVELFFDSGEPVIWRPSIEVDGAILAGALQGLLERPVLAVTALDADTNRINVIRPDRIVRMVIHPGPDSL